MDRTRRVHDTVLTADFSNSVPLFMQNEHGVYAPLEGFGTLNCVDSVG